MGLTHNEFLPFQHQEIRNADRLVPMIRGHLNRGGCFITASWLENVAWCWCFVSRSKGFVCLQAARAAYLKSTSYLNPGFTSFLRFPTSLQLRTDVWSRTVTLSLSIDERRRPLYEVVISVPTRLTPPLILAPFSCGSGFAQV